MKPCSVYCTGESYSKSVLSISDLQTRFELSQSQICKEIAAKDLFNLAKCFRSQSGLFEKLNLCPADCTNAENKCQVKIQAGIEYALQEWHRKNPETSTFVELLEIVLSLDSGDTAFNICEYIKQEVI